MKLRLLHKLYVKSISANGTKIWANEEEPTLQQLVKVEEFEEGFEDVFKYFAKLPIVKYIWVDVPHEYPS